MSAEIESRKASGKLVQTNPSTCLINTQALTY